MIIFDIKHPFSALIAIYFWNSITIHSHLPSLVLLFDVCSLRSILTCPSGGRYWPGRSHAFLASFRRNFHSFEIFSYPRSKVNMKKTYSSNSFPINFLDAANLLAQSAFSHEKAVLYAYQRVFQLKIVIFFLSVEWKMIWYHWFVHILLQIDHGWSWHTGSRRGAPSRPLSSHPFKVI